MIKSQRVLALAAVGAIGFIAGQVSNDTPVNAEIRQSAPRQAFQSGSERSLATLESMVRHLKSIDQRLARIEKMASGEAAKKTKK